MLFHAESAELREEYLPVIDKMAEQVRAHAGGEVVIAANGETQALAYDRARAVQSALLSRLDPGQAQDLKVSLRTDSGRSGQHPGRARRDAGARHGAVRYRFVGDQARVRPVIDKVAADIAKLGGGVVGVVGHADQRGSDAYNVALGLRRAKAVYAAIAAKLDPEVRSKLRVEISDDPTAPVGLQGRQEVRHEQDDEQDDAPHRADRRAVLFVAVPVHAQDAAPAPANDAVQCTDAGCSSDQGVLMRVRTRGEREPVTSGTTNASSSAALQPDRRVTVETEQPGKAVATGKWSVQLPNGGVIWATEDPDLGQPSLSVSAPSLVAFDGTRITAPVRFHAYSNYPGFIERAEVLVYRASDTDLVEPVCACRCRVAAVSDAQWDGALPAGLVARQGDELVYPGARHGADGSVDETWPNRLQLVKPHGKPSAARSCCAMRWNASQGRRSRSRMPNRVRSPTACSA